MKREQREPYQFIGEISGLGLCNFCKYADFEGSWCCAELHCEHPLPIINENEDMEDNIWAGGGDCWGFRPRFDLQVAGAMAGIILEGNTPHWNKKGELVAIIPSLNDLKEYA